MIELCGVTKRFGQQTVLHGLDAVFADGESVCVMGPSGAGKTTLANLLLGLLAPDAGTVRTHGARFSCAFQEERLLPQLSAEANVRFACGRAAEARQALGAVGLAGEDLAKPAAQLSGGQQRRVSLVRALLAASDCVILDEPFKGLDDAARAQAAAFVKAHKGDRTLLCITHDAHDAAALDARVFLLAPAANEAPQSAGR